MAKISRIISHKNKFSTAFTLIELLVVISIIGLLSSVVIASVTAARKQGMIAAGQKFDAHTHSAFYDDLVLSWDFDRDTASPVQDLSGNGNNLSLTGATLDGPPTPNPFKTGKVISIGPSKTANLPAPMKKPPAGKFSVSFWLYPVLATGAVPQATDYLSYMPPSGTPPNNTWKFSYAVGGTAGFNFKYIPLLPSDQRTVSIGQLAFNTWHHIVAVCSTVNNKIGVYVNGKSVGTPLSVTGCSFNTNMAMRLDGTQQYYLDNVRIYGESLPLSFIQEQYLAGKPKFEALAKNMKDQKN